ncbi:putative nuclease HARBI1 [Apostichopus japonicus]|uniref:Putative nuclease HARBI1 n=1 Tax=Stichopus japonicus TaxID=307972 RepID=A0A2G8KGM4_STIJA|nr:putative nuclease HARBI1 [Apostichopus japonicus]
MKESVSRFCSFLLRVGTLGDRMQGEWIGEVPPHASSNAYPVLRTWIEYLKEDDPQICFLPSYHTFLATGDSYKSFAYSYRVGKSTIVGIVPETCEILWRKLQPLYMPVPKRKDWETTAEGFLNRWQFPNCIGAIDGKHVVIQTPPNSGSVFFNYKHTFSVVLMAIVDHMYCFTVIDVGAFGSCSDGGIFARSQIGRQMDSNELNIPPYQQLPGAPEIGKLPFVAVGDEAFPLKINFMRPYPGQHLCEGKRIYNYRLSRARRVVENAFGILAARWRIYQRGFSCNHRMWIKLLKQPVPCTTFYRKLHNPHR